MTNKKKCKCGISRKLPVDGNFDTATEFKCMDCGGYEKVETVTNNKCGETHTTCQTRLDKEGGKARCCYCRPHERCTLGMESKNEVVTNNNWEEEFDKTFFYVPTNDEEAFFSQAPTRVRLKSFILSLLEKERKEAVREVVEKIEKCKLDIIKYQNTTEMLNKNANRHEKAWINNGFRLSLESINELLKYCLATMKEDYQLNKEK